MIKHVLVHVDATTAGETCLDYAISLARHLDARLTGVHVRPPPEVAPLYKPSQVGPAVRRIENRASDRAEAAAACFMNAIGETDLEWNWLGLFGDMAEEIGKAAGFADLTVLSQSRHSGMPLNYLSLAEVTVMKCAGPVLIVPEDAKPVIPAKALFSWDGRRETARALLTAIPLIQGCRTTVEVACDAGSDTSDLGQLVDHLTRHGITVFSSDPGKPDSAHPARLVKRRHDAGFDLVIIGAFSRAPWREILFGGPTLAVTRNARVPVLAYH